MSTQDTNTAAAAGPALSEGLGLVGGQKGYFGSLFQNILVMRVPEGPWWYVVVVNDRALQWRMYCREAEIVPAHSGEVTDLLCLGETHKLPCWRVDRNNYVSESMVIASLPQVAMA